MKYSYNERLFKKGSIRSYFHLARFRWLRKAICEYCNEAKSVLELGSFDGRSIEYIPPQFNLYQGYDADWEDAINLANAKFKKQSNVTFFKSLTPQTFNPEKKIFDISISLETLEHVKISDLQEYLTILQTSTSKYTFISVPNETGPVLILKYFVKRVIFRHAYDRYNLRELYNIITGRMDKIKRTEHSHKGFDYRNFTKLLEKYFYIEKIVGLPFSYLPISLNFTVAYILKSKK